MKFRNALIIYIEFASQPKEHHKTLELVKKVLRENNIKTEVRPRTSFSKKTLRGKDIIITVGGDGTYLSVSQLITDKTPILGVNSNIKRKVGFLCNSSRFDFREKFEKILNDKHKMIELTRIECRIGKRMTEPFLNEVFYGNSKPYKLSKYYITAHGKREYQRSSGIIIGTATGSNAWLRSAGAKKMKRTSKDLQLLVREPHKGSLWDFRILNRMFKPGEKIIITPIENNNILIGDSVGKEYRIRPREKITIKRSPHSLNAIFF